MCATLLWIRTYHKRIPKTRSICARQTKRPESLRRLDWTCSRNWSYIWWFDYWMTWVKWIVNVWIKRASVLLQVVVPHAYSLKEGGFNKVMQRRLTQFYPFVYGIEYVGIIIYALIKFTQFFPLIRPFSHSPHQGQSSVKSKSYTGIHYTLNCISGCWTFPLSLIASDTTTAWLHSLLCSQPIFHFSQFRAWFFSVRSTNCILLAASQVVNMEFIDQCPRLCVCVLQSVLFSIFLHRLKGGGA